MDPAQPLVLTKEEHALLGELIEIIGLIEHMMAESAARFDGAASQKILKQATGKSQATIWANTIRNHVKDPKIARLIPISEKEIEDVAEERNDFIHTLFTGDYAAPGYMEPGYQTTSATRSRTGLKRPVSDLHGIRDRAAELSCLIAKIVNAIM